MKPITKSALALLVVLSTAASTFAQSRIRPPLQRPTTSPYLNLLRGPGGGGLGFNYYQRVRPQFDYLETTQRLSRSLNQVERRQSQMLQQLETGRSPTGHPTAFQNYGGYYAK